MEELAQSLNHQIQSRSVSSIYSAVKVIVLYWADGSKDFREEGQLLGEFFAKSFNYDVDEFPIPSTTSYLNLHNFVTKSLLNVIKAAKEKRGLALLIIHYGGHGDQNDDRRRGEEERSVWAAYDDLSREFKRVAYLIESQSIKWRPYTRLVSHTRGFGRLCCRHSTPT